MLNCIDEEKTKFYIVGEAIEDTMKKIKGGNLKMAWEKYDDAMKQKCLDLLRQGKTISEVVEIANGPKKKALIRWAEHSNVSYKK
ncbi:MAG: hypothetical protein NT076_05015 [Candidatus Pacearchaeota archaeon]|nr:hypothetical protein [Candidatus Pacearchaeota archaeon]